MDKIRAFIKKYISPLYVAMLIFSLILWYLIKLGDVYTAKVPVHLNIGGAKIEVDCVAEGTGYNILKGRYFGQGSITLSRSDVQMTRSVLNEREYVVNAYSLQNAISSKINNLRIISVGEIPTVTFDNTTE